MSSRQLYLATRNQHKISELQVLLGADAWQVLPATALDPEIGWVESGRTFAENARIKALKLKEYTDAVVLADDSGLVVDILGGAPGVYSSRYAGIDGDDAGNNRKLLKELSDTPMARRQAEFVCCLLWLDEAGKERTVYGRCGGVILPKLQGQSGFGYDPLFYLPSLGKTMAELSSAEKNQISHRGRALAAFKAAQR